MRPPSLVYTDSYGKAFCAVRGPMPKNARSNTTASCSSASSSQPARSACSAANPAARPASSEASAASPASASANAASISVS